MQAQGEGTRACYFILAYVWFESFHSHALTVPSRTLRSTRSRANKPVSTEFTLGLVILVRNAKNLASTQFSWDMHESTAV